MAKKISLQLEINGVKQSVSSIGDLEKQIKALKTQLEGVEIGSDEFNKLSGEIRKAQNFAEDLNESLKPQELEKRVGAYAKVGSAIVSSFAAANATIALFGEESEDVAKAAAKAQAVLTIALTAREVAEGLVAVKTVAANIATYASAAAANAATVATRALWVALASNPLTAILAGIGLVVGALLTFSSTSEKAVNTSKELAKATSEEANSLKNSLFILTKMNGVRALQAREIEKLKKEYPGFNAFVDKENKLNAQGIRFLELKIKQYELEAQAKIVTQKIAENGVKILEIERQNLFDNLSFWQEAWIAIKTGGNISLVTQERIKKATEEQQESVKKLRDENELWVGSLRSIYEQTNVVLEQLKPLENQTTQQVQIEEKLNTTREDTKKKQEQLNEAYKKGQTDIISFKEQLESLDKALKKYDETIKNIEKITISAPITEELENIKRQRTEAAKILNSEISEVQQGINALTKIPQDEFLKIFVNFRQALETAFTKPAESIQKYDAILQLTLKNTKNLSQEQRELLVNFAQGYKDLDTIIKTTPGFQAFIDKFTKLNEKNTDFKLSWNQSINDVKGSEGTWSFLLNVLGDLTAASGEFKLEIDDTSKQIQKFKFDPLLARNNAQKFYSELRQSLFEPITKDLLQQRKTFLENSLASEGLAEDVRANLEGQLNKVTLAIKNFKAGEKIDSTIIAEKDIEQAIDNSINNFKNLLRAATAGEQGVLQVALRVQELQKELAGSPELLSKAIGGVVKKGIQSITDVVFGAESETKKLRKKFSDDFKNDKEEQEKFAQTLASQGIKVTKEQYKDLESAYVDFKMAEVEATKKAEQEKRQQIQETLQTVGVYLQMFSQALNQTASLANQSIQNQLEFLEKSYQSQLEQVVGDTESANAKRTELEKQYQEERKQLEKQGRLTALRFSLAQSIANAAQAITGVWAQYAAVPGGQIIAGIQSAIIAGITTAEIAIINEQINMAQMFRRGGLLKAQGGMLLSGPSHEQGGIPLAQMGVIAEGQEAIINRSSLINYRDLLSTINQAGGGRPLVVNSFDDTRIVEAIAEQKQKPLRAYVLQSEITNEQALSKRLDDLSKI